MICPQCKETIPDISRYCLHCGFCLNAPEDHSSEQGHEEPIDWEKRILCSDGSCTGTVENGRCRVCGRPGPVENS